MNKNRIKSIYDFERIYFPQGTKKKSEMENTPQKIGSLWAKEAIEKIKKNLEYIS